MNSILWWLTLTLKTSVFVYLKDIDDEANRVELEEEPDEINIDEERNFFDCFSEF